jgi:hypothetical protein
MDDLQALNKRILAHSGTPNDNIETVIELISVCLGKLKPSGQALSEFVGQLAQQSHENPLDVVSINKEYLQFARQSARDVTAGYFDGLIVLNIDFAQARVLARLTNQQITEISRRWDGLVFEAAGATALQVQRLHESAAPHYSVALLAAAA